MRIGALARRAGASKGCAVLGTTGLVVPARRSNGYRGYDEDDVGVVIEIGNCPAAVHTGQGWLFVECLCPGHQHGDEARLWGRPIAPASPNATRRSPLPTARQNLLLRKLDQSAGPYIREGAIR